MTSKQEKLAAARKRLKEFQGKSKEVEISKQRIITDSEAPKISKDDFSFIKSTGKTSPVVSSSEDFQTSESSTECYQVVQPVNREATAEEENEKKTLGSSFNEEILSNFQSKFNSSNQSLISGYPGRILEEENKFEISSSDSSNGPKIDFIESVDIRNNEIRNSSNCFTTNEALVLSERNKGDISRRYQRNDMYPAWIEPKKFFESDVCDNSALKETITSLQMELQSHSQTITILVQQRNDAQTALSDMQSLLNKKSGEAAGLAQQLAHLKSSFDGVTERLFEAEALIRKLNAEKQENLEKWNESKSVIDRVQAQLIGKEEEFQEMKRKYEEKSNDCQQLLVRLQDTQGQLSFCQIQLQQYTNEEHSGPAAQVLELQNENEALKSKIGELKKELETESSEKEESSQKFHIYAQQCNSQLSSLNSQLISLKLEKENLFKENLILSKNLSELESAKEKKPPPCQTHEMEIADLHDQISDLSGENKKLNSDLKLKEEKCMHLESIIEEKETELSKLVSEVRELLEENKKLTREVETPKAYDRLLATMESDKIAAAKAVSQNQRLKDQVIELEQAFMKLSEEKLELTNQLAHEKHVNAELQNTLRNAGTVNHEDHHHECHHEESELLVNDSNEIEELRNIVRQLQDDKMELTARLNSYEAAKKEDAKNEKEEEADVVLEEGENGTECENTKLLLQQMQEKVKKTMNEIAVLDEEKEKLEHLVLQLQGETETIGEYITLYQKQRMLLKQRAQEKDSQLLQLFRDKEELKSKLAALDDLVQRLLAERETISISPGSKLVDLSSPVQIPENTAGKIRALISEIGSTTLISNQAFAFEHCSCCSGRLITI